LACCGGHRWSYFLGMGEVMTGFQSKKNMAQEKLAQPAQEPVVCKHEWFRTGAMEINEFRCIKCGTWNTIKDKNT